MTEKKKSFTDTPTELCLNLLKQMGIEDAVVKTKKAEDKKELDIATESSGILIGRHGETIAALQTIIGIINYRLTGKWERIVIDVGGYWKARKDKLKQWAEQVAEKAKETGRSQTLPFMSSLERRLVHEALSDDSEVTTESIGEAMERRLVISPKVGE